MAVKLRAFGRNLLLADKLLEVTSSAPRWCAPTCCRKFLPTDDRSAETTRCSPSKLRKNLIVIASAVCGTKYPCVISSSSRCNARVSGNELIARSRRQHQKIRCPPFAFDAIARLRRRRIDAEDMRPLHLASGFRRAIQQHAVQHRARINDDRMRHVERRAMIVAADQLDGMHQFFRIRIVEQEREALDGFVREPAAARLLPRQVLVENIDRMSGARQAARRTSRRKVRRRRSLCLPSCFLLTVSKSVAGSMSAPESHEVAKPANLLAR